MSTTSASRGGGAVPVAVAPSISGPFVNGVWNGSVTVLAPATGMCLRAEAATGVVADSAIFDAIEDTTLPEAVDNDTVAWTTGGSADWTGQRDVTHDGEDAAQSGTVGNNQQSWMETAVSGAGSVSFWWSVSSEDGWDWLEFMVDGAVVDRITGETPWTRVVQPLGAGEHVLRWRYVKDRMDADPVGQDRGYVDEVVIATLSLAEALDHPGATWTTGGQAVWCGQTAVSHDGVDAAQSGTVGNNQQSWMETTVSGAGTFSFWWCVSSEADWDWLEFMVDGSVAERVSGEVAWTNVTVPLGAGNHTLRWRYVKDRVDLDPVGEDCAWVDQVVWIPDSPVDGAVAIESFQFVSGQYELVVASADVASVAVLFRTNLTAGADWSPLPGQSVQDEGNGQYRIRFTRPDTDCGFFRVAGEEVP